MHCRAKNTIRPALIDVRFKFRAGQLDAEIARMFAALHASKSPNLLGEPGGMPAEMRALALGLRPNSLAARSKSRAH
jgi:hypothetical protein